MSAKVELLDETKRKSERVRRAVAEYLVRQLLAVQISRYLYQRIKVRAASEVTAESQHPRYHDPGPSQSPRSGTLKWEPPASKRNLKGHPWSGIFVTS